MNLPETAELLAMAQAAYPNSNVDSNTADVWASILADIPPLVAAEALRDHITTSRWFPACSELIWKADRIQERNASQRRALERGAEPERDPRLGEISRGVLKRINPDYEPRPNVALHRDGALVLSEDEYRLIDERRRAAVAELAKLEAKPA